MTTDLDVFKTVNTNIQSKLFDQLNEIAQMKKDHETELNKKDDQVKSLEKKMNEINSELTGLEKKLKKAKRDGKTAKGFEA